MARILRTIFLVSTFISAFLFSSPQKKITGVNSVISLAPFPILDHSPVTLVYTPSEDDIANPERGYATEADLSELDFSDYGSNKTLTYFVIRLDEYRERDIPPSFLEKIDGWFSTIRTNGIKAIVRFAYNDGPYPDSEPDASLEQILIHIDQLRPVLERNTDVIAWVQTGFIGAWGEWHTSTHGLDESMEAKQRVLFSLLDAVPTNRMVQVRYPNDIMNIFPEPLSIEDAYTETYQARVGFHDDCFLASYRSESTFARDPDFSIAMEYDYLSQLTRFVPVGGESCLFNPPRSDCPTALEELALFHFSDISDEWYPPIIESWKQQGCFDEIKKRLGYRFTLESITSKRILQPGEIFNIDVALENNGFASLINPRPVYFVLDGPSRYEIRIPVDPRYWAAGETSSFRALVRIPTRAPEGRYQLALWMPDDYQNLRNDSRFSIRFANENIWREQSGYNVLRTIDIDSVVQP